MFCLKFQQNRTINDEYDFFEGGGGGEERPGGIGTPIHKFLSLLLLINK